MQRRWVLALTLASGLLAQAPPPEPPAPPTPAQEPEPKPVEVTPDLPAPAQAPAPAPATAAAFEQLRPSQRKLAYTLQRAALAAHELGYYRSHPRFLEVRTALEDVVAAGLYIPEKSKASLAAVEAYLGSLRLNHGLYAADGKKLLMEGTWKDLQTALRAAAKTGPKGLEPRLARLKGLLFDPKVDAAAPSWAEPEAPAKGKKAKAAKDPKVPEGFHEQKAITALWVKRAQAWVENRPQEVEVQGEKKMKRLPDPVQTKALTDLAAWLEGDDMALLRDPGFGWLDLRRLGADPGAGLLAHAADMAASKAPEGPAGELALLPVLEPVLGESRFAKGDEKRMVLADVKQGAPAATLDAQLLRFEQLGRTREFEVK